MSGLGPAEPRVLPKLEASEAQRVRALLVVALVLLLPAAFGLRSKQAQNQPLPHCRAGVWVLPSGDLSCTNQRGEPAASLPAWWMGTSLDLNQASAATLTVVDGVGQKLSAKIVAHRRVHGPFAAVGDVQNVKGIGPKLAAKIAQVAQVYPLSDQRSVDASGNSKR
jgi:competence ComEA-like helix-hairpin-helix protein